MYFLDSDAKVPLSISDDTAPFSPPLLPNLGSILNLHSLLPDGNPPPFPDKADGQPAQGLHTFTRPQLSPSAQRHRCQPSSSRRRAHLLPHADANSGLRFQMAEVQGDGEEALSRAAVLGFSQIWFSFF